MTTYAGIDLGSISTEAVIVDDEEIVGQSTIRTKADQTEGAEEALSEALPEHMSRSDVSYIVSTGYGRSDVLETVSDEEATEITLQCLGVAHRVPDVDVVIDVGGQDTKIIRHDIDGQVADFRLNEKCAAGTGRFIETLADALDMELDDIGDAKLEENLELTSYCAVFAESEVISLRSEGHSKEKIASAVNASFANKVAGQANRLYMDGDIIVVTGGMALNDAFIGFLEEELGTDVHVPDSPQTTCAYGAAIAARKRAPNSEIATAERSA